MDSLAAITVYFRVIAQAMRQERTAGADICQDDERLGYALCRIIVYFWHSFSIVICTLLFALFNLGTLVYRHLYGV